MCQAILFALWQTVYMVVVAGAVAVVIGLPLGVLLKVWRSESLGQQKLAYRVLSLLVNAMRSVPFIILMVAIIPFTRWVVGTSIGTVAAMVPLAMAAFPFVARVVENALDEVPMGLIETAEAMGASQWQLITQFLLPEALAGIARGVTLMLVTLVGYSAMAGAVGGGGLGDLAIRYGYERFDVSVMIITVAILIVLVQVMQWGGDRLALKVAKK